ncbi:MAG: P-loop NTPase [Patescibacteria group bacterium]|nr:P-loop NTPase [Patescibacteria group bacterium]
MIKKIDKIAITGGKGGTGKSTISILLANSLVRQGKKVILCDCDVECPNDYLLLGEKLTKPLEKTFAEFPKLDKKKCDKCVSLNKEEHISKKTPLVRSGLCVRTCRNNAIFQAPGEYPVFIKDLCSACGACQIVCPQKAILTQKETTGKIFSNKINSQLWLVTGEAKPRLEETSPIVKQTKRIALKLAKKVGADLILFDTAAGTHCSVISALLGCRTAYAVTEPTPMGNYDLNLILDLCQKIKLPVKIILNQANLGDKKGIQKTAHKFKVKIEKEIPYSKKLVTAYSKGKLLNVKDPELKL